jgi:tetratricopeptide (TPR) repeat protein/CHAT domain-containing protein
MEKDAVNSTAQYKNFYLVVTAHDGKYFVQVADSPVGESNDPSEFTVPFGDQEIQHILLRLENAILRNARAVRSRFVEADLHKIGDQLFQALLVQPSAVQKLYEGSRRQLARADRLRVKLRIEPPLLGALPWEYFYDSLVVKDYLGLHAQTSLIRYMQLPLPIEKLSVRGPLRILGMVASPSQETDSRYLNATDERTRIDKAIQVLHAEGAIDFKWVPGESKNDLYDSLTQGEWHVFHFIGHGGVLEDQGFLEMGGEGGMPVRAFGSDLTRLFRLQPTLRLVVLNCCDSAHGQTSLAKELVSGGIPAVLAMQFPISDDAAIELAGAFYDALAKGEPVDGAVTRARIKIQMNHRTSIEWGIPVLYMRAPDGQIFERVMSSDEPPRRAPAWPDIAPKTTFVALPAGGAPAGAAPAGENVVVSNPIARRQPNDDPFEALAEGIDQPEQPGTAEFLRDINLAELSISDLNTLVERGKELLSAGGSEEIRQRLAKIYYQLGIRHQNENSLSKAFVNLSSAIDLDSMQPEFLYARANVFARTQRYEAGTADLKRAIEIDPQRGDLHWAKGVIYLLASRTPGGSDQLKVAVEAFTTAIGCNSYTAKYFSSRGAAYSRLAQPVAALADLDSALRLDPADARTYYNRGHLRRRQGNNSGAEEDLRHAAELGFSEAVSELQGRLNEAGGTRH